MSLVEFVEGCVHCRDFQHTSYTVDDARTTSKFDIMALKEKGLGRKRQGDVWTHFIYYLAERNTQCMVVMGDG